MFKQGIREFNDAVKEKIGESLLKKSCLYDDTFKVRDKLYLCQSCNLNLTTKKKRPSWSVMNQLFLDEIPEELKLTDLENQLIAKNLIFMKLKKLPKSRMGAMADRVINVPLHDEDIVKTVTSLPRSLEESHLVPVKFKRMKALKNSHAEAFVRPEKLLQALKALKAAGNPHYINIEVDENFEAKNQGSSKEMWNTLTNKEDLKDDAQKEQEDKMEIDGIMICDDAQDELQENMEIDDGQDVQEKMEKDDAESSDDEEEQKDPIKANQATIDEITCMISKYPEVDVVVNTTKITKKVPVRDTTESTDPSMVVELAPGEGKVPTNFLRETDWDVKAFPSLHPSGKYGADFDREDKLTASKYANQRLLNKDNRFANDPSYIFASQQRIETENIEGQIDISFQKGKIEKKGDSVKVLSDHDAYSVFKKIKGTPKFWQNARNDLLAMLNHLGPFHMFFTLSAAEKRWHQVIVAILEKDGHKITEKNGGLEPSDILVDDVPLEEFLENMQESLHELFNKNILLITRMFDNRSRDFINNILMNQGKYGMKVVHYCYRIEFQARGMPHIHGVAWLDKESLKKYMIDDNGCEFNLEKVPELIDNFISCSTNGPNEKLNKIVKEVQVHHHTKTCRKKNNSCRFNYPKPPSDRTIVAIPLDTEIPKED